MKKLIIIIILVNISSFFMILFIGKKTTPSIYKYLDSESYPIFQQNKEADFDNNEVNKLLLEITTNIQNSLLNLEEGKVKSFNISHNLKNNGIVCSIPIGTVLGIPLLSNLGPVIPVRISFIGDVISNLKTTIKSYGINNVYLQVDIVVEVSEQITMPLMTEVKKIKIVSPLFIRVIQGKIPNYYLNDITRESNSTILE